MTSDRERFEFSSEKCEEIAEFRLFLRISGQKSLGRLFYQNNLPNMRQDSGNHTIRRFLPPSGGVGANNPPPRFLVFHFYSYKDERVRYTWI